MQTYTQDFNDAIRSADREMRGYLEFNGDSTKQIHDNTGLIQFVVHQNLMEAERFCVGSCSAFYCEASFFNSGIPAGVSLANSYFDAYVGVTLPDTTVEYKCMGRFYISEISRNKETTAVVGYDAAHLLNADYVPTVTKSASGYYVMDILNDIIDQTGVNGGTHFSGSPFNFYVPELVEGNCKQQWAWLTLCAYNTSRPGTNAYGSLSSLGNVAMRSYSLGEPEYTNYPAITDDQIYMDGLELGDSFTISSFTTGTQENPIVKGSGVGVNNENPYITDAQATAIYNGLHGVSYTPMTLHFRGDPCISPFDSLKVTTGGVDYRCVAMKIVSTFNGGFEQTIECFGDSEAYYEMSYSPMEAKIQTNNTLIKEIAQAIETADGGVITKVLDTDGTWKELVIANNQDLSQATSVWRWNINGLGHTTSYQGGTYNFALDDQGRIVATLIQTGILQDALGKNSWNLDTGAFTITDGSISITTNSNSSDLIDLRWASGGNSGETTMSTGGYSVWDYNSSLSRTSQITLNNGYLTASYYTGNFGTLQGTASVSGVEGFKYRDGNQTDRAKLDSTGLVFYNSSGTQTAIYPANPSTLLSDNSLYVSSMKGSITEDVASATTKTYTLTSGIWLLTTAKYNNSSTAHTGMWIVSARSGGTSNIMPVLTPSGGTTTASISNLTLSVTTGATYVWVNCFKIS